MSKGGGKKLGGDLGWRSDEVSDEDFNRGFDEHFRPGLWDNPLWVLSPWEEAFKALAETPANPDLLALLLRQSYPPPQWVCDRLSDLISSGAKSSSDDRFELKRTPAWTRKAKTIEHRVRTGAAYHAARAAGSNECDALTEALTVSGMKDDNYVRKARALFNRLPDFLKRRALGARK